MPKRHPLKIKRILLENIRGFQRLELDLTESAGIVNWVVLLGDNGVGKTTLLRCIALALGDRDHAATFLRDSPGAWLREDTKDQGGTIKLELYSEENPRQRPSITVTIAAERKREFISDHQTTPKSFPFDNIFVCGYGAGRGIKGTEDYDFYRSIDSVYTLFQEHTPLQNPELILRRLGDNKRRRNALLKQIDKLLMLEPGSTSLSETGLQMKGPWGRSMSFDSVGDGYKSTTNWVSDLLGWAMYFYGEVVSPNNLAGIVLIDEVDQHLHPRWQRRIIQLLNMQFPKIQFIVTTHSPVSTLGTTDLRDEECKLVVLRHAEDGVVDQIYDGMPRGRRVDQILASALFGLRLVSDDETAAQIDRLADFGGKKLNRAQREKRKELIGEIRGKIAIESTEWQGVVRKAFGIAVEELAKENLEKDPEAISLEITRQIQRLSPKSSGGKR